LDEKLSFVIPGFPDAKTRRDALIYSLWYTGLKAPSIAINLLKLDVQSKAPPAEGLQEFDDEASGLLDEILDRQFEREARRRGIIIKPASEEPDDEDPE
jgi:hypothetical protein